MASVFSTMLLLLRSMQRNITMLKGWYAVQGKCSWLLNVLNVMSFVPLFFEGCWLLTGMFTMAKVFSTVLRRTQGQMYLRVWYCISYWSLPCRTKQIKENRFVWPSTIYTWMSFVYFSVCSTSLGTAMSTRAFGLIFKNQIMTMWEREKEPDLISMYRGIRQASYHIKHPQSIIQTVLHYIMSHLVFFMGGLGPFCLFVYLTCITSALNSLICCVGGNEQ